MHSEPPSSKEPCTKGKLHHPKLLIKWYSDYYLAAVVCIDLPWGPCTGMAVTGREDSGISGTLTYD